MEEGRNKEREKQIVLISVSSGLPLFLDDNWVSVGLSEWVLSEHTRCITEKFGRQEVRRDVPEDGLRMNKTPSTRELSPSQHPSLLRACNKRNFQSVSCIV